MSEGMRWLNELIGMDQQRDQPHILWVLASGLASFFAHDVVRLLITSAGGAAITYAVLVVRIDERQQQNIKAVAEQHVEIEALKRRAEDNARVNAQQQTMIEIETRQHQIEMNLTRRDIESLRRDLITHELDDKRRFGK